MHQGLGAASGFGGGTLLDHGVEVVIAVALVSPVPVLMATPGRKVAMEVRRNGERMKGSLRVIKILNHA